MTNIWLLSRESMKGMDLLTIAVDALHACEQLSSKEKALSNEEIEQKLDKGSELFEMLERVAKDQISKKYPRDLYLLMVVEALERATGLPPSELAQKLHKGKLEFKAKTPSEETKDILRKLTQKIMGMTSRSVDAISTALH